MNSTWWVKPDDLDEKQKAVIDLPLDNSHLILGPPGSGKTNLLLLRASQMVLSGRSDVLILVFTRTLREFVSTAGHQYAFGDDKLQTLSSWSTRFLRDFGITALEDDAFDVQRAKRLKQIESLIDDQKLSGVYDAIVLDEAQDYLPGEIAVLSRLGRVLFAAADNRQKIYPLPDGSGNFLISHFGANVFSLKHHYRNGQAICALADALGKPWKDYSPLSPTSNYDEKGYPSKVTTKRCVDLENQIDELVSSMRLQMKAYPDEYFGVLCPSRATLEIVWSYLSKSSVADYALLQSVKNGYGEFHPSKPICVCTIHGAKGLEFRTVHIMDAESMKKSSLNRNIAYMAVTRAKTSLTFYHTNSLPPYLDSAIAATEPPVPPAKLNQLFKSSSV